MGMAYCELAAVSVKQKLGLMKSTIIILGKDIGLLLVRYYDAQMKHQGHLHTGAIHAVVFWLIDSKGFLS